MGKPKLDFMLENFQVYKYRLLGCFSLYQNHNICAFEFAIRSYEPSLNNFSVPVSESLRAVTLSACLIVSYTTCVAAMTSRKTKYQIHATFIYKDSYLNIFAII